ncbi:MAG: type II/IV secretion system protein [Planctomycetota bacterium]|nr:MAG: type II/IV secretion system protein [Planctomycetota bacterium]
MNIVGLDEVRLEDTLRDCALVDADELGRGMQAGEAHEGERVSQRLLRTGVVDEDVLLRALAAQNDLPFVKVEPGLGDSHVLDVVDKDWARTHSVLPLYQVHGELTCAVADPTDLFTMDALRRLTGLELRLVVAHPADIEQGLSKSNEAMASMLVDEIIRDVGGQVGEDELEVVETAIEETDLAQQAGANPVVRFVNVIILKAIRDKASDIHIEPDEAVLRVRFRIDGMLRQDEKLNPPLGLASAIVSRIKIMSGLDIAERRMPQDGRMRVNTGGNAIDLRVSVLPTYTGEKVVIRILDKSSMMGDLSVLGISDRILTALNVQVRQPNGVILVTGPTGSGKTTTLYAALASINDVERNICTVEDPTEYSLPMINQVQVNARAGLTFATALRSLLRQDPDVMMVGEIRDQETAKIAIEASLTGHLVFSTLHTNDAVAAIPRLVNMGVESYLLAAAMNAIMAQRLVRRVCDHCKLPHSPSEREQAIFARYEISIGQLLKGEGCKTCGGTGFTGRLGIHEIFEIDDDVRDLITVDPSLSSLRNMAAEKGHKDLAFDGLCKAAQGLTTLDEVVRVAEIER